MKRSLLIASGLLALATVPLQTHTANAVPLSDSEVMGLAMRNPDAVALSNSFIGSGDFIEDIEEIQGDIQAIVQDRLAHNRVKLRRDRSALTADLRDLRQDIQEALRGLPVASDSE